jgi:hypothetical protein
MAADLRIQYREVKAPEGRQYRRGIDQTIESGDARVDGESQMFQVRVIGHHIPHGQLHTQVAVQPQGTQAGARRDVIVG